MSQLLHKLKSEFVAEAKRFFEPAKDWRVLTGVAVVSVLGVAAEYRIKAMRAESSKGHSRTNELQGAQSAGMPDLNTNFSPTSTNLGAAITNRGTRTRWSE